MATLPLDQAITRFQTNDDRLDRFVNGDANTDMITSGGQAVPSVRKIESQLRAEVDQDISAFLSQKDTQINESANSILSQAQTAAGTATTRAGEAATARTQAQGFRNEAEGFRNQAQTASNKIPTPAAGDAGRVPLANADGTFGLATLSGVFASRAALAAAFVIGLTAVSTAGYANSLDMGGADWVEVANSGPLKSYQVQSNGGTKRWQMVGDTWNIRQFGAVANGRSGNTDNTAAIQAAIDATIETRRGELFAPGGSYGIGSTVAVNLTDTTIAGRGVTCNLVGAGSDATEFFWLANNNNSMFNIVGPAGTNNNNLGGVQNLHWRGFSAHMLWQGKGTFISTKYIGHSKFEDIYSFEFDVHWQMIDALVVLMDRVRASNGRRGFWAYRGDFTYPNAFTFVACTFGGMNEWGVIGESISGWTFIGGSIEGNGASVAFTSRGGLLLTNPGPEGGLGLTVEGTYFEYNGGTADILITANASFPSLHKIAGVFNRGSTPANAVHNVYVQTDTGYPPVNVDYTGSAFVSFPGYSPSGSTVRLTKAGAGPVRFHGSAYFKDAAEAPVNADTAPIAEAQFNIAASPVVSRSSNVASVVKNAVGDYTINFSQPKRGDAYVECMTDGVVIVSKFAESATMVRLRLFSVGAVLADPPSSIAVRIFA